MFLMTTVDDLPAEGLPYIIEKTIQEGAKNIHVVNALTKKGRMEYMIFVDVDQKHLNDIISLFALEFGTLGIKAFHTEHIMLPFDVFTKTVTIKAKKTALESKIHVKCLKENDKIISVKSEYEDVKRMALELDSCGVKIPFSKLKALIEAETYNEILKEEEIQLSFE